MLPKTGHNGTILLTFLVSQNDNVTLSCEDKSTDFFLMRRNRVRKIARNFRKNVEYVVL